MWWVTFYSGQPVFFISVEQRDVASNYMRFTFADVQNSRIPAVLGVGPNDPRLLQWTNEGTQRLLFSGKWWGTVSRFNICATSGCITLPKPIATIEAVNLNGRPTPVRDFWYEFLANGAGTRQSQVSSGTSTSGSCCGSGCCGMNEAIQRGNFPVFTDIKGTTSKANFICDLAADIGNQVLVLGYDQNGNWIRTVQNGVYADGEVLTLAQNPGVISQNFFQIITGIQFLNQMNGQSWLYGYDTANNNLLTMLGHYQYDETNPSYRRYFFPSIFSSQSSSGCTQTKVEVAGKLDYYPIKNPTDYLIIGNIPALKEMLSALKKAENEPDSVKANQIIATGMDTAIQVLDAELDHQLGSGRTIGMTIEGSSVGSNEPVLNFL